MKSQKDPAFDFLFCLYLFCIDALARKISEINLKIKRLPVVDVVTLTILKEEHSYMNLSTTFLCKSVQPLTLLRNIS